MTWNKVQRPLCLGGLGVLDLQSMGTALKLRWLWLQRVDPGHPWVGLPLDEDRATRAFIMDSLRCVVGNSTTIQFLSDPWSDVHSITHLAPELAAVVPARHRK
jgi:hypothetical protein